MGNEKLLFKNKELSKVACATEVKKRVPLLCPLGKECRRREPGSPDVPVEVRGWGGWDAALSRKRPGAVFVP